MVRNYNQNGKKEIYTGLSLLFIPDISGFTKFVTTTEISHSQHIISELLEILIKTNDLNLTISEIEGDAILFYKQDQIPEFERILVQVKKMFTAFHAHLRRYERDRICHCGACSSASRLTLKFIAHAGDLGFVNVRDLKKPHGEDVIMVHLLLKNSIEDPEYLLLTQPLIEKLGGNDALKLPDWVDLKEGNDRYEGIEEIYYRYLSLNPLLAEIPELPPLRNPKKKRDPIRFEIDINRDVNEVYEIISNLDLRLSWNKNIDELNYEKDRVNRAGTRHVCLIDDREIEIETVKNDFGKNRMVYGERLLHFPFVRELTVYYILEAVHKYTKLIIEAHYHSLPMFGWLFTPILKSRIKKMIAFSLPGIKEACERNHKLLTVESSR